MRSWTSKNHLTAFPSMCVLCLSMWTLQGCQKELPWGKTCSVLSNKQGELHVLSYLNLKTSPCVTDLRKLRLRRVRSSSKVTWDMAGSELEPRINPGVPLWDPIVLFLMRLIQNLLPWSSSRCALGEERLLLELQGTLPSGAVCSKILPFLH